jgi:hypothetical protein
MGLILSEPIKKVVEILKILAKMSVEDAKIHPKRPYREMPQKKPMNKLFIGFQPQRGRLAVS